MNKKAKILFFCMIFANSVAFSQSRPVKARQMLLLQQVFNPSFQVGKALKQGKTIDTYKTAPLFLSPNFYASQLGFFCKQEIKLDKITKMPFRFRLGSVEECNRLEGKKQ